MFNSFSFRLMLAELLFCVRLPTRKGSHLGIAAYIALMLSLPAIISVVLKTPFYSIPMIGWHGYDISFLVQFVISLSFIFVSFKISLWDLLFLGAGAYIIQNLLYDVTWLVKLLFFPGISTYSIYDGLDIFTPNKELLIYNTFSALVFLGGFLLMYPVLIVRWHENHGLYIGHTRLIVFLASTIALLNVISSLASSADNGNPFVPALLAFCSILLLSIQFNIFDLSKEKYERELEEYIYRTAADQRKMSDEKMALINMKAHDLKHSLEAIRHEMGSGVAERELAEAELAISDFNTIIQTGNRALDTILTEKNIVCGQSGIEFTCIADGDAVAFMDSVDLYILFGNALDNAIERLRLERLENRIISLKISQKEVGVIISIENFCSDVLTFEDGLPQTIKANKNFHGFGLRSIRSIVEKYKGNMVIRQQGKMFILNLMFPLQSDL